MPPTTSQSMASASMDDKKKGKKKGMSADETALLGSTIQGGGTGTMVGAGVGSLFGPVGTVAGGAIGGMVDKNQAEKDAASAGPRPKRRRLAQAQTIAQEKRANKQRALATLSQAVFDWAAALR